MKNLKISVVGNANSIFDKNYGFLIDNCDICIRMNKAVILDENKQGKKFDIISSSPSAYNLFWRNEKNITFKEAWVLILNNNYSIKTMFEKMKIRTMSFNNDFINHLTVKLNSKPSIGFVVLNYLDLLECKNVSIFGFDWKKSKSYHQDDNKLNIGPHNFDLEKKLSFNLFTKNDWLFYSNE